MEWLHTISTIVATLIMLGASFKFMWSRLDKKFGEIDKKFDAIEKKFELIDRKFDLVIQELKEIKMDIRSLEQRITRLETQDEERFRNDIKVFIKEKASH